MNRVEKFILEHNMLYQILADPLFWEAVPEFAAFKDEGEAAHFFAFERLMKPREVVPGCVGCTSLRASLQPILTAMSDDIARWAQEDVSKLDNLISYITKRRGFRPQPIVVYHKDNRGVVRPVEF
jgi:hypothetical protein|tara:strand:- start:7401 stop:7775 length:375 start_codon:yes stop_codon:yes gene_type:complete